MKLARCLSYRRNNMNLFHATITFVQITTKVMGAFPTILGESKINKIIDKHLLIPKEFHSE